MTNYEQIKNMSVEEMATVIAHGISCDPCEYCEACAYECYGDECHNLEDSEVIQKWLEREVEE